MSTHRSLIKSAGVIGFLTGISRLLGFVRDLIIATAFGTSVGAEAFVVSFKIPNLLRDLVGEGAANSAFVPVLIECREKRKEEFWRLVSTLFFIMAGVLALISLMGVFLAPWVVKILAPGFVSSASADKFPLTVRLTRVIFPYIFLIGLSALAMGVLNSLKEFASSALGPILLNLSMIVAGAFFERRFGPMALVIGVLAGGVLQLGCQFPPLLKNGFRWSEPRFKDSSVKKIGKLLLPRAFGSALYQINIFVDSILASFEKIVGPGGQSALYYSNRLFQLPLAIFGLAMAQAVLPTFSSQMAQNDMRAFKETFSMTLRSLMLVVLPASAGLIVLARPIIRTLFERGRFDAHSTQITSGALFFYAFGLLSCCVVKILVNAFYAVHDTKTPVKTMLVAVALNVIFSLILMKPLKIGGLALASTLSVTLNMGMLYGLLKKKVGDPGERKILQSFLKMLAAAAVMGSLVALYNRFVLERVVSEPGWVRVSCLFFGILAGILVYVASLFALRAEEIKKVFR